MLAFAMNETPDPVLNPMKRARTRAKVNPGVILSQVPSAPMLINRLLGNYETDVLMYCPK